MDQLKLLPDVIVFEILDRIKENVDKISFVLTAKRYWMLRRFLRFTVPSVLEDDEQMLIHQIFNVKSHLRSFEDQRQRASSYIHYVTGRDLNKKETTNPTFGTNYTHVILHNARKEQIYCNSLPECCVHLNVGHHYNIPFDQGIFKNNRRIQSITFGYYFNRPLHVLNLPVNLTYLQLGASFNQRIAPNTLPTTLKTLIFKDYHSKLDFPFEIGSLPASLTTLKLASYSHPIEVGILPFGLKNLVFSDNFNHPLTGSILPPGLTTLKLGYSFQCQVDLPQSLTRLSLEQSFGSIPTIPSTLRKLSVSGDINTSLTNYCHLIDTLTIYMEQFDHQKLSCFKRLSKLYLYNVELLDSSLDFIVPPTVKVLSIEDGIVGYRIILPPSLEKLTINDPSVLKYQSLPSTVYCFKYYGKGIFDFSKLPTTVQHLSFSCEHWQHIRFTPNIKRISSRIALIRSSMKFQEEQR
ncbi:hypothetical protein PPL_07304 [Heterostelium album PN500]|uniref:FNIP repeat-containing protein n=1 Tax=Heterostelium pallidum (strain ATCC 26659 / Pp 5 / PN500) TaxID=670386 RepID=D3BEY8_HETP5|nr:hypothetical protein PPL_07304 [Heterostelium album PN500]EFA80469.1 hypothetical protein PPL_07304 [Heterostelium album PN500]|eukprot:XP_020432589.1 hypothetical protein PPL_07304 [Heterostelium album PN500]